MKLWHSTRDSCGRVRSRALSAAAAAALVFGLVSCGDSEQEEPTAAPLPTSSSSDGGGEASDGRGDASDGGGDSDEDKDDGVAGTAAPEASDGGGNRITMTKDDFPPPNPADYPGMNTHTEQGAIATAMYYWDAFYWASWSGEFEKFEVFHAEECGGCQEIAGVAQDSYRKSRYLTPSTAISRPDELSIKKTEQEFDYIVYSTFDERVTARDLKGDEDHIEVAHGMIWSDDRWVISRIELRPLADEGRAS